MRFICKNTSEKYEVRKPERWVEVNGTWKAEWTCPVCGEPARSRAVYFIPRNLRRPSVYLEGVTKALDGCKVELDGTCPHGLPSWHLVMGWV